jgi:hypothetical protein
VNVIAGIKTASRVFSIVPNIVAPDASSYLGDVASRELPAPVTESARVFLEI